AGLLLNYREARRQSVASRELIRMSLELDGRGQLADRFMKALDQLSDRGKLDLRIGAIYASEAVARESDTLHWPVMEVLSAFVRRNGRESAAEASGGPRQVAPDVQAALAVLLRRDRTRDQGR